MNVYSILIFFSGLSEVSPPQNKTTKIPTMLKNAILKNCKLT